VIEAPEPITSALRAQSLAKRLSKMALVLAGTVLTLLALIEYELMPDSEVATAVSFLAAALAPILALAGVGLTMFAGGKISWLEASALLLGGLVVLWPLVFIWAYSGCPQGIC